MHETYAITGRGGRVKHILNADGTAFCGQAKATQPATGRFEKLPVHGECREAAEKAALAEAKAAPRTVHLSARVARFLAAELATKRPEVADALRGAKLVRNGRGYTAYVTASQTVCEVLLEEMRGLNAQMLAGERTTRGMGFRQEAVAKGIDHVTLGLMGLV